MAKYNRANQIWDGLRQEIGTFSEQDPPPHFSRGYFDTDRWEWIERFIVREAPPLRWALTLGDCVHNLRSSLDHLACQLTLLGGGSMEDCAKTQFPIASKSETRFDRMADRSIVGLSPKHRWMVKRFQPFQAGSNAFKHPLSILADLSNTDKHRLLNPTFSVLKSDSRKVLDDLVNSYQGPGPSPVKSWWMLERGSELKNGSAWFRIVFDRELMPEAPASVELGGVMRLGTAFGEIGLDAHSYRQIIGYVYAIIERFMRQFPETKYIDQPRS